MKKLIYLSFLIIILSSCLNDDFLERYPLGEPTTETVFVSSENFQIYANGLYETFGGVWYGEADSDNVSNNMTKISSENTWIRGLVVVPESHGKTPWAQYSYIRRVNIMLDNIDGSSMTEKDRKHWRSVGYFFRSYRYYHSLLSQYGDVPWIDHVLNDSEIDVIFGKRDSRDFVADKILKDLQYAEQNINVDGNGSNTINKIVVQTLLSRFCLFEGTWRKYHKLADANVYLNECKRVSKAVITSVSNIHYDYDALFNSLDLKGVAGMILYKPYSIAAKVTHNTALSATTTTGIQTDIPRDMIDSYLCKDGKTRWNSDDFKGDKDMHDEFTDRDYRMLFQVIPPYKTSRPVGAGGWDVRWDYTDDPKDRIFMDKLLAIPGQGEYRKSLPLKQSFKGPALTAIPHYSFFRGNQPWAPSAFGYNSWKYYNTFIGMGGGSNTEEVDKPIFRVEEIMLNYAEVMAELGEFTQAVADETINKLRVRVNVASMDVASINSSFDPKRDLGDITNYPEDYEVAPILWEIRRERRVELFQEGLRLDDLRRWKKCHYVLKKKLGQWIDKKDFPEGTAISIHGGGDSGYLEFHPKQTHKWSEHYYLLPIPSNQIVLNKNLEQNPGWE